MIKHQKVIVKNLPQHMIDYRKKTNTNPDFISIDNDILEEIWYLWDLGITTTGCCQGDYKVPATIGVIDEDIPKMKNLGYKTHFNIMRPNDKDVFVPQFTK